jgi:ribonucleoside-diphosphate reductase alpha chain
MKEPFLEALEPQQVTIDTLLEKYAKGDERSELEIFRRVSWGVAQAEAPEIRDYWAKTFHDNMIAGAIGAGRIMSAAGSEIRATLANCFVQPIGDAIQGRDEAGLPGIYEALKQAAETMRRGGGVGYDFSHIRPRGAFVRGTHSNASGPCSYMDVFDKSCSTVESAGARRGAQMGVLRIDHPDVLEFITAKRTQGRWNNFNVSVGVVEGFMEAVVADAHWELVHKAEPGKDQIAAGAHQRADGKWVYAKVPAKEIFNTIMRSTYDFAEPGILFLDNMNRDNNLRCVERIEATNPCGEQPLPAYGCCDLGPIILTRFVRNPFSADAHFDVEAFKKAVTIQVRFLDDVLDVTHWPLDEQRREAQQKRRIGVGFTGLGDTLIMLGRRYDAEEGREKAVEIACVMRNAAYTASVELAKEKGAFPLFKAEEYLEDGTFASRLPESLKNEIRTHGIRNSHLLSIAPTGTVSLAFADNASGGIEPPFSLAYTRKKRLKDGGHTFYAVKDHAFRVFSETVCATNLRQGLIDAVCNFKSEFVVDGETCQVSDVLPKSFVTALAMSADDHLRMMARVQPYIDTAISKTVNIPVDYPYDDFKGLYLKAWRAGLKGLSTYRPNDTLGSVLSVEGSAPAPAEARPAAPVASDDDPLRKPFDSRPEGELEGVTRKVEYRTFDGQKSVYLTVNFLRVKGVLEGQEVEIERPIEFFVPAGQRDEGQQWVSSNMRLLSMVARSGSSVAKALANMREVVWDKGPVRCGLLEKEDGSRAPMFHDSEVAAIGYALQQILLKRGFLDAGGSQVPARQLYERLKRRGDRSSAELVEARSPRTAPSGPMVANGKKCPDCGAHALHKVDGCLKCSNCGHVGACG